MRFAIRLVAAVTIISFGTAAGWENGKPLSGLFLGVLLVIIAACLAEMIELAKSS